MSRNAFTIDIATPDSLWQFDKRKLRAVMRQAGAEVSNTAKALMRASGGGRTYYGSGGSAYRPYQSGRRTASKPGTAPAVATRMLMRSLKIYPFKSGEGAAIRATAFYGLFLESGAQGTSRIGSHKKGHYTRVGVRVVEPRPFLSAALAIRAGSLDTRIKAAVEDGIAFKKIK